MQSIDAFVRIGKLMTFALVSGLLILGAVVVFVADRRERPQPNMIMRVVGPVVMAVNSIAAFVVPGVIRGQAIRRFQATGEVLPAHPDAQAQVSPPLKQLLQGFQQATIVGQALFEGAAVINLVFFLICRQPWMIGVAAIGVIGIIWQMPSLHGTLERLNNIRTEP